MATDTNTRSDSVGQGMQPCPWCATNEHLSYQWPGSMTADMPDRPCRVICTHIGHDTVVGPTAYGKHEATVAWNTRPPLCRHGHRDPYALCSHCEAA